jgi:hypothetical protein
LNTAKEIREKVTRALDRLSKIRSTNLIREDALGPRLSFRAGIPFFERTLTLYRQLAGADLSRTPSAILEIVAKHTDESLRQFEQIEAFDPAGMDRPEQIRNLLISDVRDAHRAIYEDLCMLLAPSSAQLERPTREPGRWLLIAVLAILAVGVIWAYQNSLLDNFIQGLDYRVNRLLKH